DGSSRVRSREPAFAACLRMSVASRFRLLGRRPAPSGLASACCRCRFAVSAPSARLDNDGPRVETMNERPSIVYVLPDKMGGMMNVASHLLEYRQPDGFSHHAVLTHNRLSVDARFARPLDCDSQTTVEYTLPLENLHAVMRRVARAIPPGPGVVVA